VRKDCDLTQRILEAEQVVGCFSAKHSRAPTSWKELAGDPCGANGIPRDWQGRELVMTTVQGHVVITDADGSRGGNWLVCGPGVLGWLALLLLLVGATIAVVSTVRRRWRVALLGATLVLAALLLNWCGPID